MEQDEGVLIARYQAGDLWARIEGERAPMPCTFDTVEIRTYMERGFKYLAVNDTSPLPDGYYFKVMNRDNDRPLVAKICKATPPFEYTEREIELAYCVGLLNQKDFTMDKLGEDLKVAPDKLKQLKAMILELRQPQ